MHRHILIEQAAGTVDIAFVATNSFVGSAFVANSFADFAFVDSTFADSAFVDSFIDS